MTGTANIENGRRPPLWRPLHREIANRTGASALVLTALRDQCTGHVPSQPWTQYVGEFLHSLTPGMVRERSALPCDGYPGGLRFVFQVISNLLDAVIVALDSVKRHVPTPVASYKRRLLAMSVETCPRTSLMA